MEANAPKRSALTVVAVCCLLFVVCVAFLTQNTPLVFLSEAISVCIVAYVILRSSGRSRMLDRREESRIFLLAGLASSLATVLLAYLPIWSETRTVNPHIQILLVIFLCLGAIGGAVFPIFRRSLRLPTVTSSVLFAFVIYLAFLAVRPFTVPEITEVAAEDGPGLLTGLLMWLVYGLFMGLIGRYLGMGRVPPKPSRRTMGLESISGVVLIIVLILWFRPIPAFRPAGKLRLTGNNLPSGFSIQDSYRPGLVRLAEADYQNDFRWGSRLGVYLCLAQNLENNGTVLGVNVYKGLRGEVKEVMDTWEEHVEGGRGIVNIRRVTAPGLGDRCLAWETGINPEVGYKHLVFSTGRFHVRLDTELITGTSPQISWDQLIALGDVIEERLSRP